MKDATRQEAIQWCIENKCDFVSPVFPPPSGWVWGAQGEGFVLSPLFTITDQGEDISYDEVYGVSR